MPNSPANVLELLRYDWVNQSPGSYGQLFTDDFEFVFSARDSAGNAFRDRPWRREDEMITAGNLFVTGTATDPPASSIALDFTTPWVVYDDDRPGKTPRWHKQTHVQLLLRVNRGENGFEIRGYAQFYLVRGDSAAISQELRDRGFMPDSARWWIERWEDETQQDGGAVPARRVAPAAGQPTRSTSLGAIKVLYR